MPSPQEHLSATIPDELDPVTLLSAASEEAGLDDFGDDCFVEPLSRWLEAINQEGRLSAVGVIATSMAVKRDLVNRLRVQDDLQKHPEIHDERLDNPVVVVGLPRTGTTKLHRMLACDPGVQKLPFWRITNPAPFPDASADAPDPRIAAAMAEVDLLAAAYPDLLAAHPFAALEPDEEVFFLQMSFESDGNGHRYHVPSFESWLQTHRRRRNDYAYLRTLLQYVQWQTGSRVNHPWVLKSPIHLRALDALLETFPGATVVHCHRDPNVAVASAIRLLEVFRGMVSDQVDLLELGREGLDFWAEATQKALVQRQSCDYACIDVAFKDVCQNPIGVIQEIYRRTGRQLDTQAEERMREWDQTNPENRSGRHTYSLERYGLQPADVEAAFGPYLQRFAAEVR